MDFIFLFLIGLFFIGFIVGMAGNSVAVKKKSLKMSERFKMVTILSLILMFAFVIIYQFVK
jgi:hypothetical protein